MEISTSLSFGIENLVYSMTVSDSVMTFQIPEGNLFTNNTYYWRVVASNMNVTEETTASNAPFIFTTQVPPSEFLLVGPADASTLYSLSPFFRWQPSTMVNSYTFQISTDSNFISSVYGKGNIPITTTTMTLFDIINLTPGTQYYWRVIAYNESGPSTAVNAPFSFIAGAAPKNFQLISPVNEALEQVLTPTLTWGIATNATNYVVEISEYESMSPPLYRTPGLPAGTLSHLVPLNILQTWKTYYWQVIASNEFGEVLASNAPSHFTTFKPNEPPANFDIVSPMYNSVVPNYTPILSWNDSTGATSYRVEVVSDTSYFIMPYVDFSHLYIYYLPGIPKNSTSITLTIDALPDTGTYYWRVIAVNSWGETIAANSPFAMIVDEQTSPWKPVSTITYKMYEARSKGHTAIWTGQEVIIWGGQNGAGPDFTYLNDGIRYHPGFDTWDYIQMTGVPSTRSGHTAIWTGTYMIIWGGFDGNQSLNDGAMYNPYTDQWYPINSFNAPLSRTRHTAVWATYTTTSPNYKSEMIVWGGFNETEGFINAGARFDPSTNIWTTISTFSTNNYYRWGTNPNWPYNTTPYQWPFDRTIYVPAGRDMHTAVWDNVTDRMIIWGGRNFAGDPLDTGGMYRPRDDSWWEFTYPPVSQYNNDPDPLPRYGHTALWSGYDMYIFGGTNGFNYFPSGSSYDGRYKAANPINEVQSTPSPSYRSIYNDTWTSFPSSDQASPRTDHTAIWTGAGAQTYTSKMLVWGGYNGSDYLNTGSQFVPAGNYWTPMTLTEAPEPRSGHIAIWTGSEMFVWGGQDNDGYLDSGGLFDHVNNIWTPIEVPIIGPPVSRAFHTIVFTTFDVNWHAAVIDKDILTPPPVPRVGDRYLIYGSPSTSTVWAGFDNSIATWSDIDDNGVGDIWVSTTAVAKMAVYVRDEKSTYKFNGANWVSVNMTPEVIVWGGATEIEGEEIAFKNGARYNPIEDTWLSIRQSSAPSERYGHTALWTYPIRANTVPRMLVWGGYNPMSNLYTNTGGEFLPGAQGGFWNQTGMVNAPSQRTGHSAVWAYDSSRPDTSNEMIVWGGYNGFNYLNDGARYNLVSPAGWSQMTNIGAPEIRKNHSAVWANTISPTMMLVWGGLGNNNNRLNTGGRYEPNLPFADTWKTMAQPPVGFARRDGHSAIWTGTTNAEDQWLTYELLETYDVGYHTAIALDSARTVHIASYNATSGDLQYTTTAPSGEWITSTIDDSNNVGEFSSIAVDSNKKVHISYFDRTIGKLKYATNASGTWAIEIVDTIGALQGLYTDIAVDHDNYSHISYYDWTNANLKYANNRTGSWEIKAVDSIGDVGQYSSIAVGTDDQAYMSYYDTKGYLKLAKIPFPGSLITTTIVDKGFNKLNGLADQKDVGMYSSIGLDSNNKVFISYYNETDGTLRFISDISGSFNYLAIEEPDVVTSTNLGLYASLSVNSAPDIPTIHISYYDKTNETLKYIQKDAYFTNWEEAVTIDNGQVGYAKSNVGRYTSITTDLFKNSYISYFDETDKNLKYTTNSWDWRNKMIVWGGFDGANYLNTGAIYDPETDSWKEMSTVNAPLKRAYHNAVFAEWKDSKGRDRFEMIVWAGWNVSQYLYDGGLYDPELDTWTPINTNGAPSARAYHGGIWMNFIKPRNSRRIREMMIWGGKISGGYTHDGSRYKP